MKKIHFKAIDLRQKPNQREQIIFAAAMVMFCFGFLKACWFPSRSVISQLQTQIVQTEADRERLAIAARIPEAQRVLARQQPLDEGVRESNLIGSVEGIRDSLKMLSQPLTLKGVKLKKILFIEQQREGRFLRQVLELQLAGTFRSVGGYIEALERLKVPFIIEEITLNLLDEQRGYLEARLVGHFYALET